MEDKKEFLYSAFISYRHLPLDKEAAELIQKKIESYTIPKEFRASYGSAKLGRAFRDEDELPATSSLTDSIYYALDHARFLIVICTPDLPESKWCEAEIKYFIKTHGRDRVIAVLADGDPAESFSPYLLHEYDENGAVISDTEPLAANIAGENHTLNKKALNKESVRIISAILGCPFDDLWQRERRAKTNRLLILAAVIVAVMAVFLGVVINRNNMIREQNEKIEAQNTELEARLSSVLVDSGLSKLKEHDIKGALEDGLSALQSNDPAIYDHRAGKLLSKSLHSYITNEVRSSVVYSQSTDIRAIRLSDDKKKILLLDRVGVLRCLDSETYRVLWEADTGDVYARICCENQADRVITISSDDGVFCRSLEDGAILWEYRQHFFLGSSFYAFSEDGTLLAYIDTDTDGNRKELIFMNTEDGSERGRIELNEDEKFTYSDLSWNYDSYAAAFSSDNSLFACCLPIELTESVNEYATQVLLIDLNSMEKTSIGAYKLDSTVFFGIDVDPEDRSVFFAAYFSRSLVTVLCEKKGKEYDYSYTLTSHGLSSPGGIEGFTREDYKKSDCSFLSKEDCVYVMSDNRLFVFDRNKNKLKNNYSLSGTIINAYWYDKENSILELATGDGYIFDYYMDYSPEKVLSSIVGNVLDQSSVSRECPLGTGSITEMGSFLTASKEAPGKLFLVEYVSDPNEKTITLSQDNSGLYYGFVFLPGSDTGLAIVNKGYDAVFFNKRTGEITDTVTYEDYLASSGLLLLDETHFLYGTEKYASDGTSETFAEPIKTGPYEKLPDSNIRLSDGRILSYAKTDCSGYRLTGVEAADDILSDLAICTVWIDGKPVETLSDPLKNKPFYYDFEAYATDIHAGANGLLMFYGNAAEINGKEAAVNETKKFYFIDALTEKITEMEDQASGSEGFKTALSHQKKLCAIAYESGGFCVYDAEEESVHNFEDQYSASEISALCFSKDDRYLLVLTSAGRLDIYETETYEKVFADNLDISGDLRDTLYMSSYTMEAEAVGDGLLFLNLANIGVIIDTSSWTELSDISGSYMNYDPAEDRIYKQNSTRTSQIVSYPVYDIPALQKMAEEALNK